MVIHHRENLAVVRVAARSVLDVLHLVGRTRSEGLRLIKAVADTQVAHIAGQVIAEHVATHANGDHQHDYRETANEFEHGPDGMGHEVRPSMALRS